MNDKTIRYIAIGLGIFVTFIILFAGDDSYIRYSVFTFEIKKTLLHSILSNIVKSFGAYSSTSEKWAYFLWFVFLGVGLFSSWKLRFKIASFITRISKFIHEKT